MDGAMDALANGVGEAMSESLNDASSLVRHQWLEQAVAELRPRFAAAGYEVPSNVRVSIGFPKHVRWRRCIGQCWYSSMSSDEHVEIFISPELGTAEQTPRIVGVVAHELVHSVVGSAAGHRAPSKRCAVAIGLTGRMTATTESDDFVAWVNDVVVNAEMLAGVATSKQHCLKDAAGLADFCGGKAVGRRGVRSASRR